MGRKNKKKHLKTDKLFAFNKKRLDAIMNSPSNIDTHNKSIDVPSNIRERFTELGLMKQKPTDADSLKHKYDNSIRNKPENVANNNFEDFTLIFEDYMLEEYEIDSIYRLCQYYQDLHTDCPEYNDFICYAKTSEECEKCSDRHFLMAFIVCCINNETESRSDNRIQIILRSIIDYNRLYNWYLIPQSNNPADLVQFTQMFAERRETRDVNFYFVRNTFNEFYGRFCTYVNIFTELGILALNQQIENPFS